MTLLDRDLDRNDIRIVILRDPVGLAIAADSGSAILVQQESYGTREEADAIRRIMNQRRPDNVYGLGPSHDGPCVEGNNLVPDFVRGRTSIYAGPLRSSPANTGMFKRIMEAMK